MFDAPEDANRSVFFVLENDPQLGRLLAPVDAFVRFALEMEQRNGEFLLRFSKLGAPIAATRRFGDLIAPEAVIHNEDTKRF